MIRFITAPNDNTSVEEVMGYVNCYINTNDFNQVSNFSNTNSVQKEYEILLGLVEKMNSSYSISASRPHIFMSIGKFSKLKMFVKKVIRKCLGWYMRDLAQQQTDYNSLVAKYANQQLVVFSQMNAELSRLRNELTEKSDD